MHLPITHIYVPYTDLKPLVYTLIHSEWQQEWDLQPNNKVVYNSLRIGTAKNVHILLFYTKILNHCV